MTDVSQFPEERLIKRLHQQFVSDLKNLYVKEAKLLAHETELVQLIKKYQKRIIVKPFFRKAEWKSPLFRKGLQSKNYYSKILSNFLTLIDLLHQNLKKQNYLFGIKKINTMELVIEEKTRKKEAPNIVSIFEKGDKKALRIITDISNMLEELDIKLLHFKDNFNGNMLQQEDIPPETFFEWLRETYAEIESKNRLLGSLKDLTRIEEELDSLIIEYNLKNYPIVK